MAGGTLSRTVHFVLHRAALDAPSKPTGSDLKQSAPPAAPPEAAAGREAEGRHVLFAVVDEAHIGAMVPKRWAKRAVTRNGIKRQIYNVSATFESRLPAAALVVRLRMDFARKDFPSAWSDALKEVVRTELQQLFERATQGGIPAQAAKAAIPAQAGIQDPAP